MSSSLLIVYFLSRFIDWSRRLNLHQFLDIEQHCITACQGVSIQREDLNEFRNYLLGMREVQLVKDVSNTVNVHLVTADCQKSAKGQSLSVVKHWLES